LLCFGKAVYLIDKQHLRLNRKVERVLLPHNAFDVLFAGVDSRELVKLGIKGIGVDARKCCFAAARRPPEDKREEVPLLYSDTQRLARPNKMLLPCVLSQSLRAYFRCQRLHAATIAF